MSNAHPTIQPPQHRDWFGYFELEPAFDLDSGNLQRRYMQLQAQYHPDRFVMKSAEEQRYASQHSMNVNEAYDVLKSPLKRAEYLLAQQGVIVNQDGAGVKPSQALLMESLEAREALEEANTAEALTDLHTQAQNNWQSCVDAISKSFKGNQLEKVAQLTIRLRYLEKLQNEIIHKQRTIR